MPNSEINSVTKLQSLWPSYAEFAADVGASEGTVQVWRTRDTIHPDHFPKIIRAARRRKIPGVTWRTLYGMRGVEA